MFGPHDYPQSTAPPPSPEELSNVLPQVADALGAGEGRFGAARNHATRRDHCDSASGRVAPPLRKASGVRAENDMPMLNRSFILVYAQAAFSRLAT